MKSKMRAYVWSLAPERLNFFGANGGVGFLAKIQHLVTCRGLFQ
jgi:hypothetical protein